MDLGLIILGLAAVALFSYSTAPEASIVPWSEPQPEPDFYPDGGTMAQPGYDFIIAQNANPPPYTLTLTNFIRLINSVIQIESGWQRDAVSSAGAIGLMQVMPANAIAYGYQPSDLYDPQINIRIGVDILRTEINKFGLRDGLAAYNGGPSKRNIPQTQAYAEKVLGVYNA